MAFYLQVTGGDTDVSVPCKVIDSAAGTPETTVAWNTAGVDLWYRRAGAAPVTMTEVSVTVAGVHADGGFAHIADGRCRLDLPDAAVAAGVPYVEYGGTFTDMIVIGGTVQLVGTGKIPGDITLVGVASTGTTTSITLTGGVATTGYYNGQLVTIVGGTGVGQSRTILSYTSGTVATVTRDWVTAPSSDSVFVVRGGDIPTILEAGSAAAGAASTITLDSAASGITGTYKNNFIMLTAGTGSGQTRLISAYDGGTKVATVIPAWTTQPVLGTVYQVLPAAMVDVGGWAGTLVPTPTTDGVPHTDLRYVDGDLITGDGAATPWGPA